MVQTTLDQLLNQLRDSLEQDDFASAVQLIEKLRAPDQAELFAELEAEDQVALLPKLDAEDSADILEELNDSDAAELVSALPISEIARIMQEMEPDEFADLLSELSDEQAESVLANQIQDTDELNEIKLLMRHPYDSAGGLMTSSYLAVTRRMKIHEALAEVKLLIPETEEIFQLFVVDKNNRLVGELTLGQLIIADPDALIMDVMDSNVISVDIGTDQEECARLMSRYDLLALPVVDKDHQLLGVITIDDVVDVLAEEATEDIQRLGATSPLDHAYLDTSIFGVVNKRVWWLLLLFFTETLTGTVLRHFEVTLEKTVALSFFVPLLIGTGGNAGSQTTTTIIRAMAVGEIGKRDAFRAVWHEFRTGFLLGVILGAVAFARALTWGTTVPVAITVAVTIFIIVLWANTLGALLPIIANIFKIDPSIVSGPAMSTLVDATGLFIYFTIAGLLLK